MSPNDAYRPVGPAHRQATEAPVFPDRAFLRRPHPMVWPTAPPAPDEIAEALRAAGHAT